MTAHRALKDLEKAPTGLEGQIGTPPVIVWGATVPTDATAGFRIGCIFIHTDGADGSALYVNEGTLASCDFNLITVA